MTYYRICGLSLLLTAIALSGCSSLAKKSEVVTPQDNSTVNTPSTTDTTDSSTSGYNISAQIEGETANADSNSTAKAVKSGKASKKKSTSEQASAPNASSSQKRGNQKYSAVGKPTQAIVYFPFDSDELSAEDIKTLQTNLVFLQANTTIKVVLKGYTDERGTVNYNLALGEKRANAVAEAAKAQEAEAVAEEAAEKTVEEVVAEVATEEVPATEEAPAAEEANEETEA